MGLTIIAFVGSVFSPYYAWSHWRDPENHCAINVALYRKGHDRWAMTERGRRALARDESSITIGPSHLRWDGAALHIDIDEWTAPLPSRLRGVVTLRPEFLTGEDYALDTAARHYWRPIAPRARVDVRFDDGGLNWSGDGYFDCNWGDEPLEKAFRAWDWSRAHTHDGTVIYYDVSPRQGPERSLALQFDRSGASGPIEPPPRNPLPHSFWRVPRTLRSPTGADHRLVRTLEDAPFYARSSLTGNVGGRPADIMHESLSLDRLSLPIVRCMLPFRMPRFAGGR